MSCCFGGFLEKGEIVFTKIRIDKILSFLQVCSLFVYNQKIEYTLVNWPDSLSWKQLPKYVQNMSVWKFQTPSALQGLSRSRWNAWGWHICAGRHVLNIPKQLRPTQTSRESSDSIDMGQSFSSHKYIMIYKHSEFVILQHIIFRAVKRLSFLIRLITGLPWINLD